MPSVAGQAAHETVYVDLFPREIRIERAWNTRQTVFHEIGETRLSDEELDVSIKEKGILQAPRVRRDHDGGYSLNFGFRRVESAQRVAPDRKISCSVMPSTGDFLEDDARALLENLTENAQRRNLHQWELAEGLHRAQRRCNMNCEELSRGVGLSAQRIERLIRIKEKLCFPLWDSWRSNPERFDANDFLRVLTLPHDQQVAAYNAHIASKRGGRPKGSRTAEPANLREIEQWRAQVAERAASATPNELLVLRGVRAALDAAENGVLDLRQLLKKSTESLSKGWLGPMPSAPKPTRARD